MSNIVVVTWSDHWRVAELILHAHAWLPPTSFLPPWPPSMEIRSTSKDEVAQKLTIEDEGISGGCISNKVVHGSQLNLSNFPE